MKLPLDGRRRRQDGAGDTPDVGQSTTLPRRDSQRERHAVRTAGSSRALAARVGMIVVRAVLIRMVVGRNAGAVGMLRATTPMRVRVTVVEIMVVEIMVVEIMVVEIMVVEIMVVMLAAAGCHFSHEARGARRDVRGPTLAFRAANSSNNPSSTVRQWRSRKHGAGKGKGTLECLFS